ncbi:hypothetical protein HYQ45_005744 [Verticillium longisporum]|uniref:Uncharacterized protein n=1 Tax=Verticillium longisporum TaxID=100787 RepID=A0A8I2ZU04_VERLO|nr:hypothetical protein HYQ45_005744 [Verticillium longisporum]
MPLANLSLVKKQFTATKMLFNILFWGVHWGIFAFGWYKQAAEPRLAPLNTLKYSTGGVCHGVFHPAAHGFPLYQLLQCRAGPASS